MHSLTTVKEPTHPLLVFWTLDNLLDTLANVNAYKTDEHSLIRLYIQ